MTKPIYLFSRDQRTHNLFRHSWYIAASRRGLPALAFCRGFGLINLGKAIFNFIKTLQGRRIVFGTSEICLYSIFSKPTDIWVFTGLGRLLIDESWQSTLVKMFLKWTYRCQTVIVLNFDDCKLVKEFIGCDATILDGEGFSFNRTSVKIKSAEEGLQFVYVGRLLKSKGVDKLVSSFSLRSLPSWRLHLIGDGDFGNGDALRIETLREMAVNSKGKIVFHGFRSDVRELLGDMDVLISLSKREGLPFSVLEGIEAGLYLVLSDVPGHRSFMGLEGVEFTSVDNIGDVFSRFQEDSTTGLKFDRNARLDICINRFGQDAIADSIFGLL
jgi:glycosyltransferase involved in cell wall biosynthesis